MPSVTEKYRTLVDLAPDPIFVLDIDEGTVVEANKHAVSLLGYDRETLIGMEVTNLHPSSQRDQYRALFEKTVTEGEMRTTQLDDETQLFLCTKDGDEIPIEIHASTVPIEDSVWVLGIARDVSARNERNSQLNRKNDRLEQFTSVVSHDLRNPLNVAQLQLDMARRDHDSEHLEAVDSALQRMEVLIEDLLSLAKQGETIDEMASVDIGSLATQCWKNVETEGATIQTTVDYEIRADESRLEQLLENLFRNAIEHSDDAVSITVGTLSNAAGFYVEDDGSGIEEETKEMVFDAGYTTTDGGTGFGLNIVEQIVEAHGWSIQVTDGTDGGSRFEITGVQRGDS